MGFQRVDTTSHRLKVAMNNAGKKQADLVRETGIDKGSMSHYVNGRYEPKQDVVFQLAKALNVSEMWLWGYDCDMKRPAILEEIQNDPVGTAELHFEILMDEDFVGLFEDFKKLNAKERKVVKELIHNMAETDA